MPRIQNWRAGGPSDGNPVASWAEGLASAFVRLDCERREEAPFAGAIMQADAGPLKISRVRAGPHTVRRLSEHARAARADVVFVNLQVAGVGYTVQGRRERRSAPFDLAFADTLEPFGITHREPFELICAAIPRELAPAALAREGGVALSGTPRGREFAKLMLGHVALLLDPTGSETTAAIAARHFLELLALAASESAGTSPGKLTAEPLLAYIGQNFRDPCLTAARAGAAFGVSERHVQKLLARRGDTFSEIVARARLEDCARALATDGAWGRSLASLAYESGFSDLSHFHRAFKARFGESPGAYREIRRPSVRSGP